ncbi:MAG: VRR-NUC domain-containing protein [Clostridia bacterium]|nr:VRR-NUC domain-containing protein [Clostridia bacterium]
MREKTIEQYLVRKTREKGGQALKFVSPGTAGVPDRLILFPIARVAFVELKAPGEKMRPLQVRRKAQLERLGFRVYCIDGIEQIEEVLNEIRTA